jgi:hypothetical protein
MWCCYCAAIVAYCTQSIPHAARHKIQRHPPLVSPLDPLRTDHTYSHTTTALTPPQEGHRPKIADDCPLLLADLMRKCWAHDPEDRATAGEVLAVFMQDSSVRLSLSSNESHRDSDLDLFRSSFDCDLPAAVGVKRASSINM